MALDAKPMNEPGIAKHGVILLFVGWVLACTTHLDAQESPYADGFPPPVPSSKAPAIDLTRNEQGFLVRSEKSHEEAAARVREYLQTQYLPKGARALPGPGFRHRSSLWPSRLSTG